MTTWSPQSTCGVKLGLCLPRRILATIEARRPTTSPSASIRCHFFSTSAGFADLVVFISAFMAADLSKTNAPPPAKGRRVAAKWQGRPEKSRKARPCRKVLSYLDEVQVHDVGCNQCARSRLEGRPLLVPAGEAAVAKSFLAHR